MWWITIPPPLESSTDSDNDSNSETTTDSINTTSIKAGHIALSSETDPADPDLALPDRSILTVGCFFILQEYRGAGLGRACWNAVEDRAREIPGCRQITLDTLDRRYETDDGPEWAGFGRKHGITFKKGGLINEDWYTRMGYRKFKTVGRYPIEGSDELLMSVFLRKDIV